MIHIFVTINDIEIFLLKIVKNIKVSKKKYIFIYKVKKI